MKQRVKEGTPLIDLVSEEIKQALGFTSDQEKMLRQIRLHSLQKTVTRNRTRERQTKQ